MRYISDDLNHQLIRGGYTDDDLLAEICNTCGSNVISSRDLTGYD